MQAFLFDFYQTQKPREAPDNQERPVVIVDIDDESLASLGQWPWPRDVLTQMLQNLMKSGAISVGFDVIFAEEDRLSPNLVASRASARNLNPNTIKELEALPSNDTIFANTLKQSRVVLGQAARGSAIPGQRKGLPSAPPLARKGSKPYPFLNSNFQAVLRNFKIIGIFTRLSVRDKKNKYLKLIPYAWELIYSRSAKSPIFKDLNYILTKYFDKKKEN